MSNYGQAALTIVGAVVGTYFGYPQLGFVLGSLAGQALFPTQLPGISGPRLQDTRTTAAMVGAPVQEVFGTDAVAGVIMFTGRVFETTTTEEVGGKGGAEQDVTTYHYFQTIAVGLGRGPMGGIFQIFENGKLVYDRSPRRDYETDAGFANRITASDAYEDNFTLYLGDEEQLPDPTLQAEIGVDNVPGFRGLMYIVFPERELLADQGYRHPNFKFVIFDEGALSCGPVTDYGTDVMFGWTGGPDPRSCLNDFVYRYDTSGGGAVYDTFGEAVSEANAARGQTMVTDFQNIGYSVTHDGPAAPHIVPYTAFPNSAFKHILLNNLSVSTWLGIVGPPATVGTGYIDACGTLTSIGVGTIFWWSGRNIGFPNPESPFANYTTSGLYMGAITCDGNLTFEPPIPIGWSDAQNANSCDLAGSCNGVGAVLFHNPDARIQVQRVPRQPDHPCFPRCGPLPPAYAEGAEYCVVGGRILSFDGGWELEDVPYRVMRAAFAGTNHEDALTAVMIARPSYHPDYNDQDFWEAQYAQCVSAGLMPAGMTYGPSSPGDTETYPNSVSYGYRLDYDACTISTEGVSLAQIITRICSRVGIGPEDIDVTDLEDKFVTGYVVSRVMDARNAIEPLRLIGYFDIVESGTIIKFPTRGKSAVLTLNEDDLGAHEYGTDVPAAVATRKMQDVELPRQIRLHYRDPGRDYEESEQLSPTRLTTLAVNDVDIECPVAITATQALQAAEVNWASSWAGRWIQQLNLDISKIQVEPTDCILVPVDGRLERVRVTSLDGPTILRRIEGVRDDADGYVSTAIAPPPVRTPSSIAVYSLTELMLLDLPPLRDQDNDAGVYAATRPSDPDMTWSGARIYRSVNGGATYSIAATVANRATMGTLAADLPVGDFYTWDEANEVIVNLVSGAFESRTEAAVLEGANTIAVGIHGSWELVQFQTVEQLSATQWRLTKLLRGRRGTEHNIGLGFAGQNVVLVSGSGIVRVPLDNADIGVPQPFKVVTSGARFVGVDQTFTPGGEALLPFSPVHISGVRDTSGDLTISWIRRNRIGQEMQSSTPLPMSEASLLFEIDIYDGSTATDVVRTLTSTTTSVVYTLAQQEEDFVTPPDSVTVGVYQISAVVDRGTPGIAEV